MTHTKPPRHKANKNFVPWRLCVSVDLNFLVITSEPVISAEVSPQIQ